MGDSRMNERGSTKKTLFILGSSVACGAGMTASWAKLLAMALGETHQVVNIAQNGFNTALTLMLQVGRVNAADAVIVSLSLPNELGTGGDLDSFKRGMLAIEAALKGKCKTVILAGPYPYASEGDHVP